jgi:hypothetical protein
VTTFTPYVACDVNNRVVLAFAADDYFIYYLGIESCQLSVLLATRDTFNRNFRPLDYTPERFAKTYTSTEQARRMIPISGAACQVLRAILAGQAVSLESVQPPQPILEKQVTQAKKNTDGPVAQIHAFLDKRLEAVKAGRTSRKDIIDQLVGKGLNQSTVVTQCGIWARDNGIQFGRSPAKSKKTAKAEKAEKATA